MTVIATLVSSRHVRRGCGYQVAIDDLVSAVWSPGRHVFRVLRFSFADGKIVTADVIADPLRLREFDLAVLDE